MLEKIDEKTKKKIKIIVTCIIIIVILWFLVLNPLLKFKNNEKIVEEAAKRYYEINNKALPTGKKISTVTLQKLYEKDFISEDLRGSYTSKLCDSKTSWVKVRKENGEYKYYVYLKCGIFSSKIDHEGPVINLKGNDIITITKGEKFKDPGISSVIDNTDGNIDIKNVKVDSSKVNTNKNGTYEIKYKIKDSFNNETIKVRTVKVEQILDKIVKKQVADNNYYKGNHYDNYVKIDGITFKIVGLNDDGTVKVVSDENLAFVDYNGVDEWLNEYFYNKLSDSAKEIIVDSKWCNEEVSNPENYKECKKYSKKQPVGLLSIADINNSIDEKKYNNLEFIHETWTSNKKDNNKIWSSNISEYAGNKKTEIISVRPVLNIKGDVNIKQGDGSVEEPYNLKGNTRYVKVNELISTAKTGEYINYSGYKWRVIGKEDDETTLIIMDDTINKEGEIYYTNYDNNGSIKYNPDRKGNIGYKVVNEITQYIKTSYFDKKTFIYSQYDKNISYDNATKIKKYKIKLSIPSVFDLYSGTLRKTYWLKDSINSSKKYCYMYYTGEFGCAKYSSDEKQEVRLVAYLNKKIKVKSGKGTKSEPYSIVK